MGLAWFCGMQPSSLERQKLKFTLQRIVWSESNNLLAFAISRVVRRLSGGSY